MDDWAYRCYLSGGIFPGEFGRLHQVTALVCFCSSAPPLCEQNDGHCHAAGWGCPCCIWAWGLTGSRLLKQSSSSTQNSTTSSTSLTWYPLGRHPPVGHPFAEFLAIFTQKKWDHAPSGSFNHHHNKRTHVDSKRAKLGVNTVLQWGHAQIDTHNWNQLWTMRAGTSQSPFQSN